VAKRRLSLRNRQTATANPHPKLWILLHNFFPCKSRLWKKARLTRIDLFTKLRKQIVVSRVFDSQQETTSLLYAATTFDLDNPYIYAQVKADYETVREALRTVGFSALTGRMGVLVQPRTKGAGHGSTTRAFYARPVFVAHIVNLARWPGLPPVVPEDPA